MFKKNSSASIRKALEVCKAVAQGDFEARIVDVSENGELGELMHAINLMIDRTDGTARRIMAIRATNHGPKRHHRVPDRMPTSRPVAKAFSATRRPSAMAATPRARGASNKVPVSVSRVARSDQSVIEIPAHSRRDAGSRQQAHA